MAIESFQHKGLKRLFEMTMLVACPPAADKLRKMLLALDNAETIAEIGAMPGWPLRPLKGDLAGSWSLTVTRNWRVVFRFGGGNVHDLDLMDYH
jgi:proteic killer suppression protein